MIKWRKRPRFASGHRGRGSGDSGTSVECGISIQNGDNFKEESEKLICNLIPSAVPTWWGAEGGERFHRTTTYCIPSGFLGWEGRLSSPLLVGGQGGGGNGNHDNVRKSATRDTNSNS